MKKLHSLLLAGVLAFSALTGAIFANSNSEAYEAEAAQKVSHSVTSKYIYDNTTDAQEGAGYDLKKDGVVCSLNSYRRLSSSESSISTMGFNVYVTRANNRIPNATFQKIRKLKVSFKVSDISESQTTFRYAIYKTDFAESNRLFFRENQPESTTTVYTAEVNVDGTDTSINEYILDIDAYSCRFLATDLTFEIYSYVEEYPVTISAGTGVSSVFLSTNENATSGSASGTNFEKGSNVYGFAVLKNGYQAGTGWTLVPETTNIFRIGEIENLSTSSAFGTISTDETISYSIGYELNGGTVSGENPTNYDVETDTFTLINPTKTGYTFTGWSGTGISGTSTSVTITKGSTGGREYTANWTPAVYNITYLDGGSTTAYTGDNFDALVKTHTYNSTTNLVAGTKPGNIFGGWFDNSGCTGDPITSIGATDRTSDFTLYAKWTVKDAVQDVIDKINAIGEVSYPGSGAAINAARTAYDALDAGDKGGVSNYSVLTDAEDDYDYLKYAGANAVKDLITAIGEVTLEKENDIVAARTAYDALTAEQKALVSNYSTLVAAEARLEELKQAYDDAQVVVNLINAIGEVSYPDSGTAINAARTAYDALTSEDQRGFVTNYSDLEDAETEYNNQKIAGVNNAKDLIDAIGAVEDTSVCKGKIDAARNAYDALTAEQKGLVAASYVQTLEDAEAEYKTLHDQNMANAVKALINAIGDVEYTETCKGKINAAREAYDSLTADQKALISAEEYKVLTDAEAEYANLKAINDAKDLIKAIGKVEYTEACKNKIDAARTAYDALTTAQKESITAEEYKVLTDAEAAYKALDDAAKAAVVKALIDDIGEVVYTDECKADIDAARTAYDLLNADQKALISEAEYKVLTDAEATYAALKADHDAADAVKGLIDAIGKVEFTDASKAKIDAANNAYKALTEAQKELVTNKQVLFDAIELYNTLAHQPQVVDNGVKVEGKDGELIPINVTVKVEVKTTVQAEQGTTAYENIQKALGGGQKIAGVYDVKLMRTVGDKVTEIQPSDIKPGMVIIIEITLPDGLNVEGLKVLHIHGENDITYIENFKINAGKLSFETDRLSEIAFVVPAPSAGLPGWAIALIVIGGLLLLCCLFFLVLFIFFPRYIIDYSKKKVIRTIYVKKHYDMVLMLDTHLRKVRRHEADVYKTREEAEKALNK